MDERVVDDDSDVRRLRDRVAIEATLELIEHVGRCIVRHVHQLFVGDMAFLQTEKNSGANFFGVERFLFSVPPAYDFNGR